VLESAKAVFSAGGPDASLEAVARHAGSASARFTATSRPARICSRRSIGARCSSSPSWRNNRKAPTPVGELRRWLKSCVGFIATKKGMLTALALTVHGSSEIYAGTFERLIKAVGALLARAVAAGEIRADIGAEDVLRALIAMCYLHDQPGWQNSVLRLVDVLSMVFACGPISDRNSAGRSTLLSAIRRPLRITQRRGVRVANASRASRASSTTRSATPPTATPKSATRRALAPLPVTISSR